MSLQVIEARNDTQKQLSRERNGRMLQDGILADHLAKQKEIERANKEMNSEVFSVVIFKYVYMSLWAIVACRCYGNPHIQIASLMIYTKALKYTDLFPFESY